MDDFDKFIEDTVFPELNPLEEIRKNKLTTFWIGITVISVIAFIIIVISLNVFAIFFVLILSLISISFFYRSIFKSYDAEFSSKAIGNIVKFINKNLEYSRNSHITEAEYKSSKLFLTGYDGFSGRDLVYGKIDKTAIKFSYLYTYYEEEDEDSNGNKTTHTCTIFAGLFLIADFNKIFSGEVYVFPHGFRLFSPRKGTKKISLEDPNFNDLFDVYGSDPVVSMYVISTSLAARLLDFKKRFNSKANFSLINSTLCLAINDYKPFKVPVFTTVLNKDIYYNYLNQLKFATGIVDDLNLNTRIWTVS
ncbi:MAG: DUF3137 domain-containing protein [Candidatus Acididesulfobacter diazotrophicus]|uniref:DUF3137 domain-containing protein n=1 Tax=Candidatus Acididesulfobacter diazotrophicus TaxID=2597226 RepID=A0A519BQG4_9DELT|nr:MAG: DUF3137 domain-containing protein [Candidatus Acididesulfobacter diazotrophicus]